MLLSIQNITVKYGAFEAVRDISVDVEHGSVVAFIGANGAGKSTILRAISGLNRPTKGEICFDGQRIDHLSPPTIVKLGIAHVPEGKRLFGEMSVLDNLKAGAYLKPNQIEEGLNEVYSHFPVLKEKAKQQSSSLSGGQQQMLATARALMAQPKLLLLDEPSLGLSPIMVQSVADTVIGLSKRGISIILVEQNAALALELASDCYVLETGRVVLKGKSEEIRNNENVRKAYLGM